MPELPKFNKENEINNIVKSLLSLKVSSKPKDSNKEDLNKKKITKKRGNDSPVYIQLTFSKNMSEISSKITKKFCRN